MDNTTQLLRLARFKIANSIRECALDNSITPRVTGKLQSSIVVTTSAEADYVIAGRGKAPYAIYVHDGTGIYGEHKTPIKPTVKKGLAFFVAGNKLVRRSVKGQKANPFLLNAADLAQAKGFKSAAKILGKGICIQISGTFKKK